MTANVIEMGRRIEAARQAQGIDAEAPTLRPVFEAPPGVAPATAEQVAARAQRERARHDRELTERRRDRRLRALHGSGVCLDGDDYPLIASGAFDAERTATAFARSWYAGAGRVLLLLGDVGGGKTFAAATLIADHGGKAVRSSRLSRLSRSGWSPHVEEYDAILGHEGLLLIDEVGKAPDAEIEASMLLELVDQRQGRGRTVITCNRAMRGTKSRPGFLDLCCPATRSRLRACATSYAPEESHDMRAAKGGAAT